jgi:hypothetical protein
VTGSGGLDLVMEAGDDCIRSLFDPDSQAGKIVDFSVNFKVNRAFVRKRPASLGRTRSRAAVVNKAIRQRSLVSLPEVTNFVYNSGCCMGGNGFLSGHREGEARRAARQSAAADRPP